jgi:hypothetical protein
MKKLEEVFRKRWVRITLLILLGFILGGGISTPKTQVKTETITVEKIVEKPVEKITTVEVNHTPQACKDVIDIDNEIFIVVGTALGEFDFETITNHLNSVKEERTAKVLDCYGS